MSALASLDIARDGSVLVATIGGELDGTNADEVVDGLLAQVNKDDAGLVLDLGPARYLDSTGVGVLFDAVRRVYGRGQSMTVVVPPLSALRRLLALTGLDNVVPVAEDRASAIAAVAASVTTT